MDRLGRKEEVQYGLPAKGLTVKFRDPETIIKIAQIINKGGFDLSNPLLQEFLNFLSKTIKSNKDILKFWK